MKHIKAPAVTVDFNSTYEYIKEFCQTTNGAWVCPGVNLGGRITLHAGDPTKPGILVFKVAGHTGWASRGRTAYYPTEFLVFAVKKASTHGRRYVYGRRIFDFTLKPQKENDDV